MVMRKHIAFTLVFVGLFVVCLLSRPAPAATYDVGAGQTYVNLKALVDAGVLADGDTIVLHNDDSSLRGQTFPPALAKLNLTAASGLVTIAPDAA